MSILSDRIDELCSERRITGYRLCKDVGMSPNVMTELRSGRRAGLSANNADKIARYFGVSVGYLLGKEDEKKPADTKADGLRARYVELYEQLTPANRALADAMLETLLKNQDNG